MADNDNQESSGLSGAGTLGGIAGAAAGGYVSYDRAANDMVKKALTGDAKISAEFKQAVSTAAQKASGPAAAKPAAAEKTVLDGVKQAASDARKAVSDGITKIRKKGTASAEAPAAGSKAQAMQKAAGTAEADAIQAWEKSLAGKPPAEQFKMVQDMRTAKGAQVPKAWGKALQKAEAGTMKAVRGNLKGANMLKHMGTGRMATVTGVTLGSAVAGGAVLHTLFGGKHTDQVEASREEPAAEPAR